VLEEQGFFITIMMASHSHEGTSALLEWRVSGGRRLERLLVNTSDGTRIAEDGGIECLMSN
jgi:hypothetical protein